MRTGQLIKCFEPLKKLRARSCTHLTGLSPQLFFDIPDRCKAELLMWFSVVLVLVSVSVLISPSLRLDDI